MPSHVLRIHHPPLAIQWHLPARVAYATCHRPRAAHNWPLPLKWVIGTPLVSRRTFVAFHPVVGEGACDGRVSRSQVSAAFSQKFC